MPDQYLPPQSDVITEQEFENPPLFSPKGRIGRVRYLAHTFWVTTVMYIIGGVLFGLVLTNETVAGIGALVLALAMGVVMFIFTINRSHDINISGWWSLIALIPLLNFFFVFKSGTPTANRFGPVPGPNTVLLWIGGLALPLFFVLGIFAAVFIPAYQDYSTRAQVGEGLTAAVSMKTSMANFYQPRGYWPKQSDLAELGLDQPQKTQFAMLHAHADTGVIEVVMDGEPNVVAGVADGSITLTPYIDNGTLRFACRSENVSQRFLPASCKDP